MALNHITFYSKLMEMEMGIDVIIPENKDVYKRQMLQLICGISVHSARIRKQL